MLRFIPFACFLLRCCVTATRICPAPNCSGLGSMRCWRQRGFCYWALEAGERGPKRGTGRCVSIEAYDCSSGYRCHVAYGTPYKCVMIYPINTCMDRNAIECSSFGEDHCYRVGGGDDKICSWDETTAQCRKSSEVPCEHHLRRGACRQVFGKCKWLGEIGDIGKIGEEPKCIKAEPRKMKLDFTTIEQGESSGFKSPSQVVVWRNDWRLHYFWRQFKAGVTHSPKIPTLGEKILVGIFPEMPSTGYTVKIKSIEERREVSVFYEIQKPRSGTITQNVTTYPFHVVKARWPRKQKNVRFVNVKDVPKRTSVSFTTVDKGDISGIGLPRKVVIRTPEFFQILWKKHKALSSPVPQLPPVDFSKYMVIGAFKALENKHIREPWNDYSLEISTIEEGPESVLVKYDTRAADPGTVCGQPFHLVQMKKTDKPIRFARI